MLKLMKELCALDGVSGYEDSVRDKIENMITDHVDEIVIDAMGSLIAYKKGERPSSRRLMICAHTDEVGALVFSVTDDGLLQFSSVGTLDPRAIMGQMVRIGPNKIRGVVAPKAMNLSDEKDKNASPSIEQLFIDIGATSKEEAQKYVRQGDPIAFDNDPLEFGDGRFRAKAIDDRLGCAVMIALIREGIPYDTYFAFSSCEEVGLRGAFALTERVRPDVSLVLEATSAADIPGVEPCNNPTRQGSGAAISLLDGGTLYNEVIVRKMTEMADNAGIPWQPRAGNKGRTDSGAIHVRACGSLTFGVSAPTRYVHSANNVVYMPDVMSVINITRLFIATMGE